MNHAEIANKIDMLMHKPCEIRSADGSMNMTVIIFAKDVINTTYMDENGMEIFERSFNVRMLNIDNTNAGGHAQVVPMQMTEEFINNYIFEIEPGRVFQKMVTAYSFLFMDINSIEKELEMLKMARNSLSQISKIPPIQKKSSNPSTDALNQVKSWFKSETLDKETINKLADAVVSSIYNNRDKNPYVNDDMNIICEDIIERWQGITDQLPISAEDLPRDNIKQLIITLNPSENK